MEKSCAMRVVFAQHLAHDTGGFLIGGFRAQAHVEHGIQDAPVDRLEPIAGIRQGPGDDDRHGLVEVGRAQGLIDIGGLDRADDLLDGFGGGVFWFGFSH